MKKIVSLNWADVKNPSHGGAEVMTHHHLKYWSENGYEVTQLTSRFPGSPDDEILDGIKTYRRSEQRKLWSVGWYYFRKLIPGKVDLVVDQYHGMPFFAPLFAKKTLALIHEVPGIIWDKTYPFPVSTIGKLLDRFNLLFYRNTPFLTVSNSTKQDLMAHGIREDLITVIENGVDIEPAAKVPVKNRELTLLFVSRLSPMKGIEDVLNAFALIAPQVETSTLHLVGRGGADYEERLRYMAEDLGIADRVTFHGYVSQEDKIRLYKDAHVLLHASVKEGWGLVVLEANTQGTPAIVYDVAGLRDSTKPGVNGVICKENSPQGLAGEVLSLWKDKTRLSALQESSLDYSRSFNWLDKQKQSLEFIKKLIGDPEPSSG